MTLLHLGTYCPTPMLPDSYRQVASGSVDLTIPDNNTPWLTVSIATVRPTATQMIPCGGFLWLKPVAISLVSCSKAEVVEYPGRKPCWSADGRRWLLTMGSKLPPLLSFMFVRYSGDLIVHLLQGGKGRFSGSDVISCSHLFQYLSCNWLCVESVSSSGYVV